MHGQSGVMKEIISSFLQESKDGKKNCWNGFSTMSWKRRAMRIGEISSDQSLLRLVVTIMMDINEEWITGRKHMAWR